MLYSCTHLATAGVKGLIYDGCVSDKPVIQRDTGRQTDRGTNRRSDDVLDGWRTCDQ